MNNQLETLYKNTEKVLSANDFKMVKLNRPDLHENTFFQKASDYKYGNKYLEGFAQVTPIREKLKIVTVHSIRVIQSNMNAKIVGANHRKRLARSKKLFCIKKINYIESKGRKMFSKF